MGITSFKDLKDFVFGRLTVLCRDTSKSKKYVYWVCKCECGNTKSIRADSLSSGITSSCGCLGVERRKSATTVHGFSSRGNKVYNAWSNMKQRCLNPKHPEYDNYGARGISICSSWMDNFLKFKEDMGDRPENFSLDRINNDQGYSKENCRWANISTQNTNKRSNIVVEYNQTKVLLYTLIKNNTIAPSTIYNRIRKNNWSVEDAIKDFSLRKSRFLTVGGETKTITEWSKKFGVPYVTIYYRLKNGWSVESAVKTDVIKKFRNKLYKG